MNFEESSRPRYETRECLVGLDDAVGNDLEGFLDLIANRAFGSDLLMDIDCTLVKIEDEFNIRIAVSGDARMIDPAVF